MTQAVIFDCFGVLVGTSYTMFKQLAPPARLSELTDAHTAADYGYISRQEYADRIGEIVGMDGVRVREAIDQQHVKNTELIEFVKNLHGRIKTALLSNVGTNVIDTVFTPMEIEELFDTVVLSYQVGMVKPDADIYRLTAERLGEPTSNCVMVDDRQEFCAGADAAGMQTIHYLSNQQAIDSIEKLLAK